MELCREVRDSVLVASVGGTQASKMQGRREAQRQDATGENNACVIIFLLLGMMSEQSKDDCNLVLFKACLPL